MLKLDEIDRKILFALQQNARASTRQISQAVGGLSKVAVAYRIRRLVNEGVIEGFTIKINGDMVERSYIVIVRVVCSKKGHSDRVVADQIANIPGFSSVYQTFGTYDIIAIGRAKDRNSASNLVYHLYSIEGVDGTDTLVAHRAVKESTDVDILNVESAS